MASEEEQKLADEWAEAMAEQGDEESSTEAEAVELDDFGKDETPKLSKEESKRLETILDIPVTISMEVGRSKITIRNLLQLNQGSVVELDRVAGEPLDVLVNGTLIAHGEVVVVNDKFGIRLTDVISQQERIKKLQ
ncbi:flagellar motor switch protein FliN [Gallaecimonas sp. GXIMD1310]|uniref:flagellar motor switch protein FliN n=1 Tax=Gallaecimonas sp. GXIMD1310 TaxID=3131926 RepID=UPI0032490455